MSSFSGGAYSYSYLANEILPMKYRFMSTGFCILFAVPFSGFAPAISLNLAANGAGGQYGGWRWVYWLMAILNVTSTLLLFLFYFTPSFKMKHSKESRLQIVKHIDYVGISIFTAGIIVFILGISWGGAAYPWDSPVVIVSIIGGFAAIVYFVLWERYGRVTQHFVPLELFQDRDWVVDNGGQVIGSALSKKITKLKLQLVVVCSVGTVFYGCMATVGAFDRASALALLILGTFCFGWNEGVTQTLVGIGVRDQKQIGIAIGIAGSIRSVISTIWSAIFVTVLDNRLTTTLPSTVGPAAVDAGLPKSSVSSLLDAFTVGTTSAFSSVPGLTPAIQQVATVVYKQGSVQAYHTVYEVSVAVSGSLALLALFAPSVDHLMNDKIAVTVHRKKDEKGLEAGATKEEETSLE